MNWLTTFKKFTLALIFATIGVISWGQTAIDLSECTIGGVQTVYGYSSGTFDISFTVVDDDDNVIPSNHYTYDITKNGAKSDVNGIGDYTLTISGVSPYTTGTLSKDFFVMAGAGTAVNPYTMETTAEWNTFAAAVNGGHDYSGEFVKLTADIGTAENPVTTMVGDLVDAVYYSFKGTFDGDDHTLTFHYNYTEPSSQHLNRVAPFRYINGATIKKLRVAGDINMDKPNAGGLFCVNDIYNDSRSNIIDCTVSVNITGYKDYCGGFAAVASNTTFTRCVYNGRLNIGRYSGGFSAQGNKKTIIDDCLCAPTAGSEIYSRSGNFVNERNAVITNSYYTLLPNPTSSILTQGTRAYTSEPPAEPAVFTHCRPLIDGENYYVEGNATIINLPDGYDYTGSEIAVTYGMTFEGTPLTETTDFIASFTPSPVKEKGDYTLTLSGNNSNNYYGSVSQTFTVIDGYLEGGGTAEDPYLIEDEHDWSVLTNKVNVGTGANSYYKLAKDLSIGTKEPITTIVGTAENPFSGHFDGGFHTLTVNINRTADYAAPFGVIYGATIENLAVEGTITSTKKYLAGIAAMANYHGSEERTNNITNCISSVNIYCNATENSGDCSTGGLLGQNEKGIMNFTNCIFNGTINGNSSGTTQKCGGFVNYNGGTINYNYCTMAGQIIDVSTNLATFNRNTVGNFVNGTISYYCIDYGGIPESNTRVQQAATDNTGLGICRKYTFNKTTYYVPGGIISGLEITAFSYSGEEIPVAPTITYYGWTLAKGTDYTVGLTYSETEEGDYESRDKIQAAGFYKMTITGRDSYEGSKLYNIIVVDVNSWAVLKKALEADGATITLYNDLTAVSNDGALVVNGTVVLDLNGHTLDRNRTAEEADGCVIKVENGASLTIINGTLTGGWNNVSGGGIYSEGNLTLIGADVINNKCRELGGGIYCHGGTFNMTGGGVIRNETTHDNLTTAGGGGIHADGVTAFEMNNVIVTENKTVSKGGGIRFHIDAIKAYINNCTITKNESKTNAQSKGGGIYFETTDKGSLDVTGGLICVNSVSAEGGGVYIIRGVVSIKDCQILGNVSGGIGGAVSAYGGNHSKIILDGCGINGNSSKNQGGGVYVGDGAEIEIQGELRIIGNESKNTESNNLYLADSDGFIKVVGSLPGAVIGVSRDGTGTLTSGLAGHGTIGNFISDCGTRVVLPVGGEAYLQYYYYYIWNVTEGWPNLEGITKDDDDNYTVDAVVAIPKNSVATANSITTGAGLLIIEDGGQLVTGSTSSAKVQMEKTVKGSTADDNGWYLVSSTVANPSITSATNLITTGEQKYDLYRYNEASDLQWENYRAGHEDFATLENGRGYLYRNENDHTINVSGTLNVSDVSYSLSYNATTAPSGNNNTLKGFNIIGNPYSHTIYKGAASSAIPNGGLLEEKYYTLSQNGEWVLTNDGTAIAPMTGILVQATEAGVLTMKNSTEGQVTPSRKSDGKNIWFTIAGGNYEDRACVEFKEGRGLNKIAHQNEDAPMLYINHKGEDFASVDMGKDTKSIDLYFKTAKMSQYTLSVKPQGEFGYLHLYDKVTDEDIDLLQEKEYTFIGSAADGADRFVVMLGPSTPSTPSTGSGTFAWQSGNDIIVNGEGTLEIYDVMGRMVMRQNVNGVETMCTSSLQTGVYIFRLEGKAQKIVLR